MGQLADYQIEEFADRGMIKPFERDGVSIITDLTGLPKNVLSYGITSYGYDTRLAPEFKVFTPYPGLIMDPKQYDPRLYTDVEADEFILMPHSYILCRTIETFDIPSDILAICVGKSTYARCGLIVNVTPLEPQWRGHVTLEISNPTTVPCRVYANEGIAQFIFLRGDKPCKKTYATKNKGRAAKYQDQVGIVTARM